MKIGVLTTSYPRTERDLAGAFVRDFVSALADRGHGVRVLAPESADEAHTLPEVVEVPYLRPRARARTFYGAGVPTNIRTDPWARPGLLTFPPALTVAAALMLRDCDALVSHWSLPCALAAGVVRGGRPHLGVVHSTDATWLGRLPGGGALAQAIEGACSTLWFSGDDVRQRFEAALGRPTRRPAIVRAMGPEALPAVPRDEARAALGVDGDVVTSLSRLVPVKGLDAVPAALAGRPDTTWLVCGDGPEREALAREAAAHGVRARFVGVVRGRDKAIALAATDLFVHPTRAAEGLVEGAPVSIVEALAAGLPVVATDSGGTAALVGDAGVVVPCDDTQALRAAIRGLLDAPARREALAVAAAVRARGFDRDDAAALAERSLARA